MNKNNKTLKDIFATALDSYKKKDLKKAEVICYKILSIDSNHFNSIFLLATIFALQANFEKAKELIISLKDNEKLAIQLCCSSTNFLDAKVLGVSLCCEKENANFIKQIDI